MVLHRKRRQGLVMKALAGIVVQVHMRHSNLVLHRFHVHGKPMVLRCDLYLAGGQVHDRLVAAMMAELELVRPPAEGEAQKLLPQADPEDRLFAEDLFYVLDRIGDRLRISWTVRQEDTIGVHGEHFLRGHGRGNNGHIATRAR